MSKATKLRVTEAGPLAALLNLPPELFDTKLVDGSTSAAIGDQSLSGWNEDVRAGRAPAPAIRGNRFTRWRLRDVVEHWKARAAAGV